MTTAPLTLLVLADPAEPRLGMLDRFRDTATIVAGDNLDAFRQTVSAADAILVWAGDRDLLQRVLAIAPRVRWVHTRAAGLDSLLFPALVESPVMLTNSSGVYSRSLGEFVAGAVLYFAKDFRRMIRNQMAGRWEQFDVEEVHGKTMGIVGYGDIGRAAAVQAKALGMRVIALRRHPERSQGDGLIDQVMAPDRLLDLMGRSDYVVASAPLTPQTKGLIDAAAISAMKRTGVLINVGRGLVIDEAALLAALREKRIRGAALDVFEQEPVPEGHLFYGLENLLFSPHCADHTQTWVDDAMHFFVQNFERFRDGVPLANVVEKRLGY